MQTPKPFNDSRRSFITGISLAAAGAILTSTPLAGMAAVKKWTVGEIIDKFLSEIKGAPFPSTVDTLKSGARENEVSGIVTCMFATVPVINEAIRQKANFIIAHEPTFYNHQDNTDWLKDDEVFKHKWELLNNHRITVWRNHDYIHSHVPDGVYEGVLNKLDWKKNTSPSKPYLLQMAATPLHSIIEDVKKKLGIERLRFIGDLNQSCEKILLMPGAAGGQRQIKAIGEIQPDLAIVGELQEWETAEYIRDARASGKKISLVVLGHVDSEDAGSIYMRDWLKKNVPDVNTNYVYSGNPFKFS